ncbi:hypothetical protein ACFQS2_06100 [Brachybacterium sp. GCM10030267]|uniref:hypothetical protein n=1 Tax=Brachybacterium sp. GCM10030267 TaxID=3273381 RepID=UPI00360A15F3
MASKKDDDWLGVLLGAILGGLFIATAWILRRLWVTLGWLALFGFALSKDVEALNSVPLRFVGVAVLLVILMVLSRRFRWLRKALPVVAEVERVREQKRRRVGNKLLRDFGFIDSNDPTAYRTAFSRGVWTIDAPLATLTDPLSVENAVRDRLAVIDGAQDVQIEQTDVGGHYRITSLSDARRDPRAEMTPLEQPLSWDGDWDAVPYGLRADGSLATHRVRECSGTVVGGLPGGGKTGGLTALLSVLVPCAAVQFLVWDGKGGHDWGWLAPRASLFNRDDEDRERIALELEAVVGVMRDRLDRMVDLRGGPSIWDTGGPSIDMPLLVLVIDECQAILDKELIPRDDKEALRYRQRTEAAISVLVRKGRSVGVWVIPTTQKPTSDSLPTTIGSNAASAIAFRVKTHEAERAIMGTAPGPSDPTATGLPAVPGYAVVSSESGDREVVRFGYLPVDAAARTAHESSNLRRAVIGPIIRPTVPTEGPSPEGESKNDATAGEARDEQTPRPRHKRAPRKSRTEAA